MPDDDRNDPQSQLDRPSSESTEDISPLLPPVIPPRTQTPFQLNQQFNIQRIPPKVWDRLSAEQIVDLSRQIINQVDRIDQRHFEAFRQRALEQTKTQRWAMVIGGLIALAGFATVAYLAGNGNRIVAAVIGTFLATILAVVVGRRIGE